MFPLTLLSLDAVMSRLNMLFPTSTAAGITKDSSGEQVVAGSVRADGTSVPSSLPAVSARTYARPQSPAGAQGPTGLHPARGRRHLSRSRRGRSGSAESCEGSRTGAQTGRGGGSDRGRQRRVETERETGGKEGRGWKWGWRREEGGEGGDAGQLARGRRQRRPVSTDSCLLNDLTSTRSLDFLRFLLFFHSTRSSTRSSSTCDGPFESSLDDHISGSYRAGEASAKPEEEAAAGPFSSPFALFSPSTAR